MILKTCNTRTSGKSRIFLDITYCERCTCWECARRRETLNQPSSPETSCFQLRPLHQLQVIRTKNCFLKVLSFEKLSVLLELTGKQWILFMSDEEKSVTDDLLKRSGLEDPVTRMKVMHVYHYAWNISYLLVAQCFHLLALKKKTEKYYILNYLLTAYLVDSYESRLSTQNLLNKPLYTCNNSYWLLLVHQ